MARPSCPRLLGVLRQNIRYRGGPEHRAGRLPHRMGRRAGTNVSHYCGALDASVTCDFKPLDEGLGRATVMRLLRLKCLHREKR